MGNIKFYNIAVMIYILLYVFDAPIQYIATNHGINTVVVLIKMSIPVLIICVGLIKVLQEKLLSKKIIELFIIIFIAITVAVINGLAKSQIFYGVKTVLPFFAFYFYARYININIKCYKKIFRILTLIIVLGLILDKYTTLPWAGLSYQIGDIQYSVSRVWSTFGIERLSGFQRASYDSATILCMLLVINSIYNIKNNKKNTLIDKVLILLSCYGIYLTTFKTGYLFIVMLIITTILYNIYKKTSYRYKIISRMLIKFFIFSVFAYSIVPPLLVLCGKEVNNFNTSDNFLNKFLFASYGVRLNTTWPTAIDLVNKSNAKFSGILGRGIGGIGTAQQHGDALAYNAGDNVFIALYVMLGIVTVYIIYKLIKMILKIKFNNTSNYIMMCFLLILFTFGATIDVIDSPLLMSTLGLLLGICVKLHSIKTTRINSQ